MLIHLLLFILGLEPLHSAGYQGEGFTIAIIDNGFFRADDPSVFDQKHIVATYDLLADSLRKGDMFSDPACSHGTMCLSTMLYQSTDFIGTAPAADYILIRTEDAYHEMPYEVDNLIKGLLLADSLNADIITISLGYFQFDDPQFDYTYSDLDGNSDLSRMVTEIANRGRLICVSAGNEGNKNWHYIDLPADARDVLTIGAVDERGVAASFSGYGPTADGRQKPEIAAYGVNVTYYDPRIQDEQGKYVGDLSKDNGTSFSTPMIAGMAACLWQAMPHLTATQLREQIISSANLYNSPDYQRGYGVPNATTIWLANDIIENENDQALPCKMLIDNQIVIIRGQYKYDIMGRPL